MGTTNGSWQRLSCEGEQSIYYELTDKLVFKFGSNQTYTCKIKTALVSERSNPNACIICFENDKDCVYMPCKHNTACIRCSKNLRDCPICRYKIEDFVRIYKSWENGLIGGRIDDNFICKFKANNVNASRNYNPVVILISIPVIEDRNGLRRLYRWHNPLPHSHSVQNLPVKKPFLISQIKIERTAWTITTYNKNVLCKPEQNFISIRIFCYQC